MNLLYGSWYEVTFRLSDNTERTIRKKDICLFFCRPYSHLRWLYADIVLHKTTFSGPGVADRKIFQKIIKMIGL